MSRRAVTLAAAVAVLAWPASAQASAYTRVEQAYEQSGTVTPCRFPSSELEAALKQAPTYDVEYFGDFSNAVQTALAAQAGGGCHRGRGVAALRETGLQGVRPPRAPASVLGGTGAPIPLPLLLALILMAGGFLYLLATGIARAGGWDPRWAQATRHAWGETEFRAGGTWAEFRDWLRE